jgi:hypothetical protein
LKRFAFERKVGKFQTKVYDKKTDAIFAARIEDVMVVSDFHSLDCDGKRIDLENYIGKLESLAAPLVERVVSEETLACLAEDERLELVRFVALQFVRGTHHRKLFEESAQQLQAELERRGLPSGEELSLTPHQVKFHGLVSIAKELPEYAAHMATKDMLLLKAPSGSAFIMGDNPVSLWNDKLGGFWGNLGLVSLGVQIHLPLSDKLVLALWCPSIRIEAASAMEVIKRRVMSLRMEACLGIHPVPVPASVESDFEKARAAVEPLEQAITEGAPYLCEASNVTHQNFLQIRHAERFVISPSGDFDLLRKMLADSDAFREGPRMTVR